MKIAIDMQGLQTGFSGSRGVGRYTRELVKSLIKNNKEHEILLVLNGAFTSSIREIMSEFNEIIESKNFFIWQNYFETSANSNPSSNIVRLAEIVRECFFWSLSADVIISTNLQEGLVDKALTSVKNIDYGAYYISTLHDLVPFYYPQYTADPLVKKWYNERLNYAKKSDIILTVSYSSKNDIISLLKIKEEQIKVIENGVDLNVFNNKGLANISILEKYNIVGKYIFYVGGNDPHKNINNLIKAFASKKELYTKVYLVLGGKSFKSDYEIISLIESYDEYIRSKINLIGFVEDEDLASLYKLSECFIFPSTHEGFGLPALEAMSCGVATLGANQSSVSEIIENPNALFNPYDINNISNLILKVLNNEDFKKVLISSGLERAKKYNWNESAIKLLEIINKIEPPKLEKFTLDNMLHKINNSDILPCTDDDLKVLSNSFANSVIIDPSKIYIDISALMLKDDKSGIQRVVRAISNSLYGIVPEKICLVYSNPSELNFKVAHKYMNMLSVNKSLEYNLDEEVCFYNRDVLLYLDLHPSNAIAHQSINESLILRGIKVYHVVYDLIPVLKKEMFWKELVEEFEMWIQSISTSSGAICISKTVAYELYEYLKSKNLFIDSFKIKYFHLGADLKSSLPTIGGLDELAISLITHLGINPSFLIVGTLEPRKGHKQTLAAFEQLWKENIDINLVIVGRFGWGMLGFDEILINHREYGKRLHWLNSISDEYLEKVYNVSSCLISASEAEGYGLPLIEAAQYKKPIIARDIPVFREVAGENAYYFDNDNNPEILAKTIKNWLELFKNNKHPKSDKMQWLTWEESANMLLKSII